MHWDHLVPVKIRYLSCTHHPQSEHYKCGIVSRFVSIQQRPGIRVVISEKFIEIFNWYEGDLEEIQNVYEKYKVCGLTGPKFWVCVLTPPPPPPPPKKKKKKFHIRNVKVEIKIFKSTDVYILGLGVTRKITM